MRHGARSSDRLSDGDRLSDESAEMDRDQIMKGLFCVGALTSC